MKKYILLSLILFFSGCTLIQQPKKVILTNYSLQTQENKQYNTSKTTLLVNKPKVSKGFNTKELIYNQEAYKFETYAKSRWIELPSSMIKTELLDSLESSNIFNNVIDIYSHAATEYILESSFSKIYHKIEGKKSFAIVKANFRLIYKSRVVKSMTFNKKVLCEVNTPYGYVKALNQAFDEIFYDLAKKLAK